MRPEQIIVTHAGTDFDGFAAMLAARRLYPSAVVTLHGGLNRNVREFVSLHAGELGVAELGRLDLSGVCRVIVVETADLGRLGEAGDVIRRPGVESVLFDHHGGERGSPPAWVTADCYVAARDGALTSTLVGILAERGIEPTPTEATAFALGIHEDTGSLTHPTTTLRDAEALAWCIRHGASQELVSLLLHTPLSGVQRTLLTSLIDAAETVDVDGTGVLVAVVRSPQYVDAVSTLAGKVLELADAQASVVAVEMEERVFVVGRSRTPAVDVAAALAPLGGGGHAQAASAIVRGRSLADVRAALVEGVRAGAAPGPRARDVMSAPAWLVEDGTTIEAAIAECRKRRTSGVLVRAGAVLAGVAARDDLDRAIGHGLAHAPVRAVMGGQVETVPADAPLLEVQRALMRAPAARVAVLADGAPAEPPVPVEALAGVVTRSDILRALRHDAEGDGRAGPADVGVNLAERLRALPGLERLWPAVQEVATDFDGVYLVGGAVRDVLLDEPSFDVDLAVEGDGVRFAERLAASLGGRAHVHERFHTAVVLAGDLRVDVATARTEHYEFPAALPTVERSSLRHDLFRRDFTINAMAVSLRPDDFGALVDPFGGKRDLDEGVLRVLHNLSFIEDPTRIFRAIRYENRYGFRMDAHTRGLARACIDMGLVENVSGARVRDELVTMLDERSVAHSLRRLCELGLAPRIHPALDCTEASVALTERLEELRRRHAAGLVRWRLRLAALARRMHGDELLPWLEELRVRRRDAATIAAAAVVGPLLAERLDAPLTPAEVADMLDPHPLEAALVAAALGRGRAPENAELYLSRLRAVRLAIDGTALLEELGMEESPRVGEVLAELLRRKRNGEIAGRDEELAAARELAAQPGGARA
jgi:tRNA nucleotidyltransferase (CCA-adding enzyme)